MYDKTVSLTQLPRVSIIFISLQTFTEEETEQALLFIKDNDLPMTDLHYALKYVRISNRAVELDGKFKEIQQRLKKLREEDMAVVSPPKCGNLSFNFFNNHEM